MTKLLCGLLICASFFSGLVVAQDAPQRCAKLYYGPPVNAKAMDELKIRITRVAPSGSITIEMSNSSKEPLRVWQDWNSWGTFSWHILRIRKGQVKTFFQTPNQGFTSNAPIFDEIAGHAHLERKIDLNKVDWCGSDGEKMNFESGDMVIVIYDVPGTHEAVNLVVWYGLTTASTVVK